jgi:hypothetical protein
LRRRSDLPHQRQFLRPVVAKIAEQPEQPDRGLSMIGLGLEHMTVLLNRLREQTELFLAERLSGDLVGIR